MFIPDNRVFACSEAPRQRPTGRFAQRTAPAFCHAGEPSTRSAATPARYRWPESRSWIAIRKAASGRIEVSDPHWGRRRDGPVLPREHRSGKFRKCPASM